MKLECKCGAAVEVPDPPPGQTAYARCPECSGVMFPPLPQPTLGDDPAFEPNRTHTRDDF